VEVARQAERLAATVGNVAANIYIKQAQDQYTTAEIQVKAAEAKFATELSSNQDETTYNQSLEKLKAATAKLRPKNPLAASNYDNYIASKSVDWDKSVKAAMKDRLEDKWEVKADILEKEYIESGEEADYTKHMLAGVALYKRDESQTKKRMAKAKEGAEKEEALRRIRANPEEFKRTLKNDKSPMLEDLPSVNNDTGKMMWAKNIAEGAIADIKIAKGALTIQQESILNKAAADPKTTTDFMERKISQSDGLTPEQKITAMNKYTAARQTMARGGGNPYIKTDNWELYSQFRERAANGTITQQEIMDNVGPGGFSWPEAERLISVLNGKSSSSEAFEDTAAAKNLTSQVKAMLPVTGTLVDREDVALNQFATQKGLGLLEDAIQNNSKWTDREKKEEALRIGRRIEQEYDSGVLELELERVVEMTTEQRAFVGKGLAPSEFKGRGIPQPKTKAEFNKLSSGTIFIDPDGVRRRKP